MANIPTTHVVSSSRELFEALQEAPQRDLGIEFRDNIALNDPIWNNASTIQLPSGRTVILQAPLSHLLDVTRSINAITDAGGKTLNFSGRAEVLNIGQNATLVFSGLSLTGAPSGLKYISPPGVPGRPVPYGLSSFPSVLCDPGCQVANNYSMSDYYATTDSCSTDSLGLVAFRAGVGLQNASAAGIVQGAAAIYLLGQGTFTFPVVDIETNKTLGNANVLVNTTVRKCLVDPTLAPGTTAASDADGNSLAAWAWVLIALGIFAVVIAAFVGILTFEYRRKRRKQTLSAEKGDSELGKGGLVNGHRLPIKNPPSIFSSGSLSSYKSTSGKLAALLPAESMCCDALDVAAAAAMDLDVAALLQLRDAWKSRIGRVHGLEFDNIVGRGGFSSVYKALWRGSSVVAVKLMEHSMDSTLTKQIQREAALATSCSHPNIVVTYKVCTAALGDLQKLPHYVEVSAAQSVHGEQAVQASNKSDESAMISAAVEEVVEPEIVEINVHQAHTIQEMTLESTESSSNQPSSSYDSSSGNDGEHVAADSALKVPEDIVATLIIMEFCDLGNMGRALHTLNAFSLSNSTSVSASETNAVALLRALIDVALGLDYLHSAAGVVHGDLKPANVLLQSVGNTKRGWIAKLGDFGVARVLEGGSAPQTTLFTRGGTAAGTNAYMSPEVIVSGALTPASDTFAFGILMYESWYAEAPYGDLVVLSAVPQLFYKVMTLGERPELRPEVDAGMPEGYKALMEQCWAQTAEERPAMAAVVAALREILNRVVKDVPQRQVEASNKRFLEILRGGA